MDTEISMIQGDASPSRVFSLVRTDGSIPDLTSAESATFNIYRPDTNAQTNASTNECTIVPPGPNGQLQYNWNATDLPIPGVYRCVLQFLDQNGKPESNIVYITVESNTV
jgi:hypothetical protein